MEKSNKYEILGIGAPLLDNLIYVSEADLEKIPGEKWGMESVDDETLRKIINESAEIPVQVAGGSSSNTIKGLAWLGHRCALTGKIGQDSIGKFIREELQELRIHSSFIESTTPTGQVISLITPDGKRTMRSYGGASQEMTAKDLNPQLFEGVPLVHLEGYTLLSPGLTEQAMKFAKKAGAKISFDLGSFEVVKQFQKPLLNLLEEYVDLVFANEDEALALGHKNPEEGCRLLSSLCEVAVVMLGEKGSLVGHHSHIEPCHSFPLLSPLIDTTGAGDLFVSGFLHGYLTGHPLPVCARYGAITASAVVQVVGAEIPAQMWPKIKLAMK